MSHAWISFNYRPGFNPWSSLDFFGNYILLNASKLLCWQTLYYSFQFHTNTYSIPLRKALETKQLLLPILKLTNCQTKKLSYSSCCFNLAALVRHKVKCIMYYNQKKVFQQCAKFWKGCNIILIVKLRDRFVWIL